MRIVVALLFALLVVVQYHLWFGDGSLREVWQLGQAIDAQQRENAALRERNRALAAEVRDLKQGDEAIEERARSELGMIEEDETFFQVIEPPPQASPERPAR